MEFILIFGSVLKHVQNINMDHSRFVSNPPHPKFLVLNQAAESNYKVL